MEDHLTDDESDWVTSVMLHGDAENYETSKLYLANHSLLRSLSAKPIRTVNKNNFRITYVPEHDDSLTTDCPDDCTCCIKCPICKKYVESGGIEKIAKRYQDKMIQTDENAKRKKKKSRTKEEFEAGDTKKRETGKERPKRYASLFSRSVDKPSSSKTFLRSLNELYPEYIKFMLQKQWKSIDATFKQKYRDNLKSTYNLSSQELRKCRKRIGDKFDANQLEKMFVMTLSEATWQQDIAEWVKSKYDSLCNETVATQKNDSFICSKSKTEPRRSFQSSTVGHRSSGFVRRQIVHNISSLTTPGVTGMDTASSRFDTQKVRKIRVKMNKTSLLRAQAIKDKHPWLKM